VIAVSAAGPVLLAHQGGWDEILLIAGPIVLIMGLLWLAKRRVDHAASLQANRGGDAANSGAGRSGSSSGSSGARPSGRPDTD
jgi:hypothetical protein